MTVRLRGRVRGSGDVLRRAELLSEDGERVDGADGEAFDLVLEDGAVVRIEVPSDAAIVPLRLDRGVWSDLAKTPGAELLGRRTPAPHARIARFSTAIVRDGDAVVVEGETTDDVAIDEAAYRTTSARRVTGARALVVGVGDEGAAAVERELAARARRARAGAYSSRVTFALSEAFHATLARWRPISALAAGTVALLACMLPPWFALYVQTTALAGLGMLAVQRHLGRTPLKFSDGNEHPMTWFFWWVIFFPPSAALMPGILALWLAVVAALIFLGTHRTARRLRVLLETAPFPAAMPDGAFGAIVGTVVDGAAGVYIVDTDRGRITLATDNAPWSSLPYEGSRRAFDGGARVLFAGRLERVGEDLHVSYGGPDSLTCFVAGPAEDPRANARSFLASRRLTTVALATLATAEVVASLVWLGLAYHV